MPEMGKQVVCVSYNIWVKKIRELGGSFDPNFFHSLALAPLLSPLARRGRPPRQGLWVCVRN